VCGYLAGIMSVVHSLRHDGSNVIAPPLRSVPSDSRTSLRRTSGGFASTNSWSSSLRYESPQTYLVRSSSSRAPGPWKSAASAAQEPKKSTRPRSQKTLVGEYGGERREDRANRRTLSALLPVSRTPPMRGG